MFKNYFYFCSLAVFFVAVLTPTQSKTGIYEDVQHFITQNEYYNHGLTIATALYSYHFLNSFIKTKRFRVDNSAALVLSFIGAYCLSKLAKKYPGYTTIGGLTVAGLTYCGIINPHI